MRAKTTTMLSALLLCGTWVTAQSISPSSTEQSSSTSQTNQTTQTSPSTPSTAPTQSTSPAQSSSPTQSPYPSSTSQTSPSAGQTTPSSGVSPSGANAGASPSTTSTQSTTTTTQSPDRSSPSSETQGQSATGTPAGSMAGGNTIKGCLSGSPMTGTYLLTDSQSGVSYNLVGANDKLRTHVGEEIQVTGQPASGMVGTSPDGSGTEVAALVTCHCGPRLRPLPAASQG